MVTEMRAFWSNFWAAFKEAYNTTFKYKPKDNTQDFRDIARINFLSIFISKLNSLSNSEATFTIDGDSNQLDDMKRLAKDLEFRRFDITSNMLADGDAWVLPATDSTGALYHRYMSQDDVTILSMDGEKIIDLVAVIDRYTDRQNNAFYLVRRHTLDGDTLKIETYTTNDRYERVTLEQWADIEGGVLLVGTDNIGVGRFKSPISSRSRSAIYGVPLNFGCSEIEQKCFNDLAMIETEFKRAESKIFADPLTLRKGKSGDSKEFWYMPEGVFPITHRAGDTGNTIDIFSPEIRYSAYYEKLNSDLAMYEQMIGTDKGFLTPFDSTGSATATEIRRSNASTISLIDKIHTSIKSGVEETLRADAALLNIGTDMYTITFDFFDPFADESEQYERLANAVDRGVAEKADELRWLFPNLSPEDIEEKLARIESKTATDEDEALERILRGQ